MISHLPLCLSAFLSICLQFFPPSSSPLPLSLLSECLLPHTLHLVQILLPFFTSYLFNNTVLPTHTSIYTLSVLSAFLSVSLAKVLHGTAPRQCHGCKTKKKSKNIQIPFLGPKPFMSSLCPFISFLISLCPNSTSAPLCALHCAAQASDGKEVFFGILLPLSWLGQALEHATG